MEQIKEISIIGAGTYGEVMHELAEELGYKVIAFYDDACELHGEKIHGVQVVGSYKEMDKSKLKNKNFIVAIGNNLIRESLMSEIMGYEGNLPSFIHPSAKISKTAFIGVGCYIQANAVIWSYTKIGNYNIISPNTVVAHHTTTGEACLISTLTGVGASIKVGDRVFIGMGSTIVTGVRIIANDTIIGAGAVVLKDICEAGTFAGVPAKRLKSRND